MFVVLVARVAMVTIKHARAECTTLSVEKIPVVLRPVI